MCIGCSMLSNGGQQHAMKQVTRHACNKRLVCPPLRLDLSCISAVVGICMSGPAVWHGQIGDAAHSLTGKDW